MDASTLPLPEGLKHAIYVDDMRELAHYEIMGDCWLVRWDSVVNGIQKTVIKKMDCEFGKSIQSFIVAERADSKERILKDDFIPRHVINYVVPNITDPIEPTYPEDFPNALMAELTKSK